MALKYYSFRINHPSTRSIAPNNIRKNVNKGILSFFLARLNFWLPLEKVRFALGNKLYISLLDIFMEDDSIGLILTVNAPTGSAPKGRREDTEVFGSELEIRELL